ncbi:MAG TPA: matrixin family metalloprotease [Myxococcota bacterium]|nr:matrixin family metalloprotease [Myxococcota bacterium]
MAQARSRAGLRRRALLALAAGLATACALPSGGADAPGGASSGSSDLEGAGEAAAYVLPSQGSVTFFLCHWSTAAPVPVSLPADATDDEQRALRAALRAWEGAGLGVRFVEVASGGAASLEISFARAGSWDEPGNTGLTLADCRVRPGARGASDGDGLDAELVYARIRLARRTPLDWRDRDRPLRPAELAGAAAHELGHALGLPGHASRTGSVMVREREEVVRLGAAILAGDALRESALRALYARPSGAVVRRVTVSAARTAPGDRLADAAAAARLAGPFVRAGEKSARVFYVEQGGAEAGVEIPDLAALRRSPERLALLPDARAEALAARRP